MYAICTQYATYNIQCTTYDTNKFTTKWAHIAFMGSYDSTNTCHILGEKRILSITQIMPLAFTPE